MQRLVGKRLPKFTSEMSKLLAGSLDFIGINHYTTLYARNDQSRIRKIVMNDASTDAGVIKTGKILKKIIVSFFGLNILTYHNVAFCHSLST